MTKKESISEAAASYDTADRARETSKTQPSAGLYPPVPDSVVQAIRLPEKRLQSDLLLELAVALYAQDVLPFGKARELARITAREFAQALGRRGVTRHYGPEEVQDDLAYARRK